MLTVSGLARPGSPILPFWWLVATSSSICTFVRVSRLGPDSRSCRQTPIDCGRSRKVALTSVSCSRFMTCTTAYPICIFVGKRNVERHSGGLIAGVMVVWVWPADFGTSARFGVIALFAVNSSSIYAWRSYSRCRFHRVAPRHVGIWGIPSESVVVVVSLKSSSHHSVLRLAARLQSWLPRPCWVGAVFLDDLVGSESSSSTSPLDGVFILEREESSPLGS